MKAHAELKKLITSKNIQSFVKDLCLHAYPWTERIPVEYLEYKIFEEFRLREDIGEKTRLGLDKKLQLIPDVVLFIKPGYRALNQQHCFTVALEIKEFKDDLMRDEKLWKYLGWTDFFFIAVPEDLTDFAFKKIDSINEEHPEYKNKIGVLGLQTGTMYNSPARSEVTVEKQNLVLQNAVYNYAFKDAKTIVFKPEEPVSAVSTPKEHVTEEEGSLKNNLQEDCKLNGDDTKQYDIPENNLQENCISKKENNKRLSDEEKAARKAAFLARQEFREKRAEVLSEKASVLPEEARQRLSSLSLKTQEVFWKIREAEAGKRLQEMATELDYSPRTIAYGLSSLTSAGLVKRAGSRKTGAYTVTDIAACDTTCATCSIALQCKDYKPV